MPDIKQWIEQVERVTAPDQWTEIRGLSHSVDRKLGEPSRHRPDQGSGEHPSRWRKVAVIMTAFALTAAATGAVIRAFRSDREGPSQPLPALKANGDIWVSTGTGEGGITIYRVEPTTGSSSVLWSDGRDPNVPRTQDEPLAVASDYSFSPDGSQVVFSNYGYDLTTRRGLGGTELFVMNADGTDVRRLTFDHGVDQFPAWSPDGRSIAYAGGRGERLACIGLFTCASHIYVVAADGGTPRQLTNDPSVGTTTPSWSPDGSRLTFVSVGANGTGTLEVMNADGSGRTRITTGSNQFISFPSWSPDGRRILFLQAEAGQRAHLLTVAPDGSDAQDLLDTNADTNFGRPVWSPDGTQIAYARVVGDVPEVWLVASNGDGSHRLATWPGVGGSPVAWRPASVDATSIAQVVCEKDGSTSVSTLSVLAQRDGVHIQVINRLAEPASMDGLGFDVNPGKSEWVSAYRPGVLQVACWPFSDHPSGAVPATVPLTILDPDHLFVDWSLQCTAADNGTALHIHLMPSPGGRSNKSITPDAARPLIHGLLADDQIVVTGYPDQIHQTVIVIREGRRIATVGFSFEHGHWIQAGGRVCGGGVMVP